MNKHRNLLFVPLALSLLLVGCGQTSDANVSLEDYIASESQKESVIQESYSIPAITKAPTDPEDIIIPEEPTTEETTVEETRPSRVGEIALAEVEGYVNVRTGPSTEYDIVGKIYGYCAADILEEVDGEGGIWFRIQSGNVNGYIMSDYFLVGEDAEKERMAQGVLMGTVLEDYLRVRSEPNLDDPDNVFTFYERGTEVYISELTEDGWAKIESDDASAGFVYAECLDIKRVFKTAITLEEEAEIIAKREAAQEAARLAEEAYLASLNAEQNPAPAPAPAPAPVNPDAVAPAPADSDPLRNAIVAYALQFVGNPYVHGGRSLETGTDCSGFTSLVYQHFGYSLSWTPSGQSTQGVQIDLSQIQPGDLLFYSNSQKYLGHVAMYIGNGQIVHAGTEATGIFVGSAYYRDPILAVRIVP